MRKETYRYAIPNLHDLPGGIGIRKSSVLTNLVADEPLSDPPIHVQHHSKVRSLDQLSIGREANNKLERQG